MKMKNKQAEQKAQKDLHRQREQEAKARRRGEPSFERTAGTKGPAKPVILIVCEGERTEPEYFRHFRLTSATIKPLGTGFDPLSLVQRAQKEAGLRNYEQVWCVFDRDIHTSFDRALSLAEQLKFKVAYSNQAFEYWLILHFEDHQGGGMHRNQHGAKLNSYLHPLGEHYDAEGGKGISANLFDLLQATDPQTNTSRRTLAIKRAKKGVRRHETDGTPPALAESSTTVYKLVEEILKYI